MCCLFSTWLYRCQFVLLVTGIAHAQYYFNDIISIRQGNEQYKIWRTQKIAGIKTVSYEPDHTVTEGFSVTQNISSDGKKVTITTQTNNQNSVTVNTYDLGVLKRTQTNNRNISILMASFSVPSNTFCSDPVFCLMNT